MEKRKIKDIASVSIMILTVVGVIGLTTFISKSLYESLTVDNNTYVLAGIADTFIPVVNEVENKMSMPFNDSTVEVQIGFYDIEASKEEQEKSLIKYDRTYMPSTGILYGSDNTFDCLSVAEGEVVNIETSDIFGSIVTIKHNNNLTTKYSSLSSVSVKVGDTVNSGEIIGVSGTNKISASKKNMVLFEMTLNGAYVNPVKYYDKKIDEISEI